MHRGNGQISRGVIDMSQVVSLDESRRRRANAARVFRIEATHAHRRADGALVVGHDPSRHKISAGICLVMAVIGGMWWSAHFRGIGPLLLLGLLAILLAALFVPPSRLEIDREAGLVRLFSYRIGSFTRRVLDLEEITDVTLVELQQPRAGGQVDLLCEIVLRLASGESIVLQDPKSARGHIDTDRLREICDAVRQEIAGEVATDG